METESKRTSHEIYGDLGFEIVRNIAKIARDQVRELADLFPFSAGCGLRWALGDNWTAITIEEKIGRQVPTTDAMTNEEVAELSAKVLPITYRNHNELMQLLGKPWFSFNRFTYVGPFKDGAFVWSDVHQHLIDWLNGPVISEVCRLNRARVLRAIPTPPQYNIESILKSLCVLESQSHSNQGTAFALQGVGIVTCNHVLNDGIGAFRSDGVFKPRNIQVIARHEAIDLAIIRADSLDLTALEAGSSDNLKQMDHVAVAGFPNYRFGDRGVFMPGLVIGFRMVSGIRRILTNAPIIAGMSGGPVINSENKVIGVAATGADRMESAGDTEHHSIIPIEALKHIRLETVQPEVK